MLHHKAVASDMGFSFGERTRILATGGASANKSILQVMADVFNAPVYIQRTTEAALIGAAFRAKYVHYRATLPVDQTDCESFYDHIIRFRPQLIQRTCEPSADSKGIYAPMQERYREMAEVLGRPPTVLP